ncbi:MAG: c-type cytochrome [Vicinamibacteria bacterium]
MRTRSLTSLLGVVTFLAAPVLADAPPKNLQLLPKTITKEELKVVMEGYTEQLGVKCTFCHVPDFPEKDDRPHKADARRMMRLVADLKAKRVDYFGPRAKENVVSCGLCHKGKAEPEPFVP